ncbi:hypothetical protein DNH61_25380, partial [Paenibacillus sambharensis]
VLGTTITAGTLTSAGTITNILTGTIASVLGATITGGTIDAVLAATITGGTLTSAGTVTDILGGTIDAVLGATITAGTITSIGTVGTVNSLTSISQKNFIELATTGVTTSDTFTPLPANTTSVLGVYSYFLVNTGANPVDWRAEVSADGANYYVDTTSTGVPAGGTDVLVPSRFLKYTRVSYRSTGAGAPSTVNIFFDAQGT